MSLVAYGSSDSEEDSEKQNVPKVDIAHKEPISKKQRETIKITIPSLDQFKDEEPEPETKVKPKFKGGSGLLSFLPPPKNSGSSEKYNFTPHVLTKKKDSEKKPQDVKSSLEKSFVNCQQITKIAKTITSKIEPISGDVSNDDDGNQNTSTSDFFSLESNNNKIEIESDVLNTDEPDESCFFTSRPAATSAQTSDLYHISSHQEAESPSSVLVTSVQGVSNVEEYNLNENYDTVTDQAETLIKDERFKKIKGRKELEDINIIDVSADDQLTGKDEWLMQSLTEEKVHRPSKRRHDMPTQLQKRKHQITYLAYQAKERELDLKNQWSLNRRTRRETQAKYGF